MNVAIARGIWEFPVRVVGVTFHLKSLSQLLSDDVEVERERGNPIDPNAVAVYSVKEDKRQHIGYLPKEIGVQIYDKQLPARGRVIWKTSETQLPGLKILV